MKIKVNKNYFLLLLIVFGGFALFGISESIKGPALPRIQSDFKLDYMQIGILLSFNSLGYLLACSFTGPLSKRVGIKFVLTLTFILLSLSGVFVYFSRSYYPLSLSTFFLFVSNGMIEIGLAIISARIFTKKMGTMLNLSHFFYGAASIFAPMAASALIKPLGWNAMYLIMLLPSALMLIPVFMCKVPPAPVIADSTQKCDIKRESAVWLLVIILSFGVVAEISISGWMCNYLEDAHSWTPSSSAMMLSAFFVAFTLARALFGPFIDRFGFLKSMILFSGIGAVMLFVGVMMGRNGAYLLVLSGACVAPIYPTAMALIAQLYPADSETVISFVVTLMGIGSIILTFILGLVNDSFTKMHNPAVGLGAGFIMLGICLVVCAVTCYTLHKKVKNKRNLSESCDTSVAQ